MPKSKNLLILVFHDRISVQNLKTGEMSDIFDVLSQNTSISGEGNL